MFKIKHIYWFYLLASVLLVVGVMSLHLLTVKQSQAALIWSKVIIDSSGWVGDYSSLVLDTANNPKIAYYSSTNSDLKYTYCSISSNCDEPGDWTVVIIDGSGGTDMGANPSLALDAANNPRISYYYFTNYDLKYAYLGGSSPNCGPGGNTWTCTTVDSDGYVGNISSLALDTSNNPRISYYDATNKDLKYAYCLVSSECNETGDWTKITVDSTDDAGSYVSLVLDSSNNPRIGYNESDYGDLKYAYCSISSNCDETSDWAKVTIDSEGWVGYDISLALDTSNNPRISYLDDTNGNLKYAYCSISSNCDETGDWTKVTVDDSADYVGTYTSLALDTANNPRISYLDQTNNNLKYAYCSISSNCDETGDWTKVSIDSVGAWSGETSLALDTSNNPRISYYYYDGANHDLKYAYGSEPGVGTATPTATVSNESPVASGVTINSSSNVNLTENTTVSVTCEGAVTDNNGCGDVQDAKAYLYRSSVASSGCDDPGEADNDQCYYADNTACSPVGGTCTGGSDLTVNYTCSVSFQYYADATDVGSYYAADNWLCSLVPQDEGAGAGDESDSGIEVNTLTALNIDASISYGTLALGANTGATNQQTVVTATGNVGIDTNLQGTAMTCATGSITVDYQEYSNGTFTYGAGTDLTGGDVELDLDVLKRDSTGGNDYTKEVYWGLGAPSQGPEGACTGTNTATAVTDANCGYTSCD